ncbi:hypothetical protein SHELI_v1c07160 [Spiroplasma helicoides]|uniref:Lipoprotein n=1 Tax=Spiroplasma helicoides TaxID=216938 RepID=A0A1B3SL63_9MOLU|nr:hypothetical protein [Spiroplasma helicoides]AOG60665.1 hypothetical protein SHELI_v1c07160 [Spiroplasma helicoides]
MKKLISLLAFSSVLVGSASSAMSCKNTEPSWIETTNKPTTKEELIKQATSYLDGHIDYLNKYNLDCEQENSCYETKTLEEFNLGNENWQKYMVYEFTWRYVYGYIWNTTFEESDILTIKSEKHEDYADQEFYLQPFTKEALDEQYKNVIGKGEEDLGIYKVNENYYKYYELVYKWATS